MHSLMVITLLYAKYTQKSVLTEFYHVRYNVRRHANGSNQLFNKHPLEIYQQPTEL